VITGAGPAGMGGMTANALCSLSLDPLLALVCFENEARTLPIAREAGRFGVNVLSSEQRQLAGVFASKLPERQKLDGVAHPARAWRPGDRGGPGLGRVRAVRADRRRRSHDRNRRGHRARARRGRAAGVVRAAVSHPARADLTAPPATSGPSARKNRNASKPLPRRCEKTSLYEHDSHHLVGTFEVLRFLPASGVSRAHHPVLGSQTRRGGSRPLTPSQRPAPAAPR
jgi:hypothetical protein